MSGAAGIRRRSHFLGTKIRTLRKRHNLTLEDLSVRCIQLDPEAAPSISYLSMIETGKRVPSERLINVVAAIFQKDADWFLDESIEEDAFEVAPAAPVGGMPLEPGFLFSERLLQLAIPELLSQTGTTGRQFAHLLIRAHQESNHNRFPDLERAAESVGNKRFPLDVEDVLRLGTRFPEPEAVLGRQDEAALLAQREAAHAERQFVSRVVAALRIETMHQATVDVGPPQHPVRPVPDRPLANLGMSVHHAFNFHCHHLRPGRASTKDGSAS